jgi:hypothetical protein
MPHAYRRGIGVKGYDKAIALDSDSAPMKINRGVAYLAKGSRGWTVTGYIIEIGAGSSSAAAYPKRGLSYYKSGDMVKDIADCTTAIKLARDDITTVISFLLWQSLYN